MGVFFDGGSTKEWKRVIGEDFPEFPDIEIESFIKKRIVGRSKGNGRKGREGRKGSKGEFQRNQDAP